MKGKNIMTLTEKVAFVKGIAEGMNLEGDTNTNKLLKAIIDVLDDMAKTVSDLEENVDYLDKYIEEVVEDLGNVEVDLFCDDDEDEDDDACDCECDDCDGDCAAVVCPGCGEEVFVDETMDFDHINCPSCGAEFSCSCETECENCSGCDGE